MMNLAPERARRGQGEIDSNQDRERGEWESGNNKQQTLPLCHEDCKAEIDTRRVMALTSKQRSIEMRLREIFVHKIRVTRRKYY